MEHHRLIHPVDELGPEVLADHLHHSVFHGVVIALAGHALDQIGAQVGGHHHHRVAEVHGPALTVGEAAVLEHLQQDVEDVRMGFLHLVEQQHGVRFTPHRLGEVAALFVAHVTRGRADQPGHGVLLHELGHIDAHHGLLGIEQEPGQSLAKLGLAHPGGAQEQEAAVRAVGVGEPGP